MGHAGGRRRVWTDARITRELTPFLAGRTIWPRRSEFVVADQVALHRAVQRYGGEAQWAERFELPLPDEITQRRRPRRESFWTEEWISERLRRLARELGYWPRQRDMDRGLYMAIWRSGGLAHWQRRLPLDQLLAEPRKQERALASVCEQPAQLERARRRTRRPAGARTGVSAFRDRAAARLR